MKLDKEIKEKRPELATRKGVIFHQNNARPHISFWKKISVKKEFGYHGEWYTLLIIDIIDWNDLEKFVYSSWYIGSQIVDYHLFCSLQNHLNGKTFDSNEAVKNELIQFFASKNQTFYENVIMKLTER